MACALAAAMLAAGAARAHAAAVQPVAQLPAGSGDAAQIANVSRDGQRLLLAMPSPGTLWSIDAHSGSAVRVASSAITPFAGQSPFGSYIAWIPRKSFRACSRKALVAPNVAGSMPQALTLPRRYAYAAMDAVAVADDGSVTVGVTPCREAIRHLAVLTAGPGQTALKVRAAYSTTPFGGSCPRTVAFFAGARDECPSGWYDFR